LAFLKLKLLIHTKIKCNGHLFYCPKDYLIKKAIDRLIKIFRRSLFFYFRYISPLFWIFYFITKSLSFFNPSFLVSIFCFACSSAAIASQYIPLYTANNIPSFQAPFGLKMAVVVPCSWSTTNLDTPNQASISLLHRQSMRICELEEKVNIIFSSFYI